MVRGRDDFRETHRIAQTSRACALDELHEVWHATKKMCACVRTVRCYLYIPVAFMTCVNVWTRNLLKKMAGEYARLQRKMKTQDNLGNT